MLDRFKRLGLKGLFEALIGNEIEIVLSNGLSFKGKITTVFSLSLNKEESVYVTLIDNNKMKTLIRVNDATVIQKRIE